MTVFLPAGTVHALGAGVVIYEIQQPSAITYRFDDWGRVDSLGRSRDLHIEEGLAVLTPDSRPDPIPPRPVASASLPGERLVGCPLFTLERWLLPGKAEIEFDSDAPSALTCLEGIATVETAAGRASIGAGETAALFACAGPVTVTAAEDGARILRGWLDPAF
jgi:mannose-6-phosphate isomerase